MKENFSLVYLLFVGHPYHQDNLENVFPEHITASKTTRVLLLRKKMLTTLG